MRKQVEAARAMAAQLVCQAAHRAFHALPAPPAVVGGGAGAAPLEGGGGGGGLMP